MEEYAELEALLGTLPDGAASPRMDERIREALEREKAKGR